MVLKLAPASSMEQEFELNTLDDNLKSVHHLNGEGGNPLTCCGGAEHLPLQQYPSTVEMLCPAVGTLPNGRRFAGDYHGFPPSPSAVAAVPESPAMQPADARTNFLEESIMWLTTQPLDLRSSDISEMDSWMLKRGYGEILSVAPQPDDPSVLQHLPRMTQQQQQPPQQAPPPCMNGYGGSVESVPGSSSGSFSDDCDSLGDMPSPSFAPPGGSPSSRAGFLMRDPKLEPADGGINDELLIALSVRDLNRKLHGYPREFISKIKQKRRTLKNRGYAQNCRTKRIALKNKLEKTNKFLEMEREKLIREKDAERQQKEKAIQDRDRAIQERDYYKQQLKQQFSIARSREYSQQGALSNGNTGSPDSPEFYI